jgi:hypothetical protein
MKDSLHNFLGLHCHQEAKRVHTNVPCKLLKVFFTELSKGIDFQPIHQ